MIVVRISEGLGNQMFQYAYAFALSKKMESKGIEVYLDTRIETGYSFDNNKIKRPLMIYNYDLSMPVASEKVLKRWDFLRQNNMIQSCLFKLMSRGNWRYKYFVEKDNYNFDLSKMDVDDNTYIDGWFQNEKYFVQYREELLKEFTYNVTIPDDLNQLIEQKDVVSLHVRRGDYVTNRDARRVLGFVGKNYYQKAIEYISKQLIDPFFLIFTNDTEWVSENICKDIKCLIVSENYNFSDIEELILMSKCKHNIIANSTFSWWAAWLNVNSDKIVIAPNRWFREYGRKNIAVDSWILI